MKVLDNNGLMRLKEILFSLFAKLESPAFTGVPTAPTAALGTASTQIATTEFVDNSVDAVLSESPAAEKAPVAGSDGKIYVGWLPAGAANGVASLDADGKIPVAQVPTKILTAEPEAADLAEGEIAYVVES